MPNQVDISALLKGLKNYEEIVLHVIPMAMYEYASVVLTDSKEICPIKKGNLVASGNVSEPVQTGEHKWTVTIGYNTAYAVFVHEILTATHGPGKSAKYLEIPMKKRAPGFLPHIAQRIQEAAHYA